jgi:hypothetical protein
MTIAEPAVTLTDYALTAECALFVVLLIATIKAPTPYRGPFVMFFASAALATLAGGTVHGFWYNENSTQYLVAWNAAMLGTGLVALMGWIIGARLLFSDPRRIRLTRLAIVAFIIYGMIVLALSNSFLVAVIFYLPATLFLLTAFLIQGTRQPGLAHRWGAAGLTLLLVAAVVQQSQTSIHPVHFDHNAVFHLIQGTGLAFIFLAASKLSRHSGQITIANS